MGLDDMANSAKDAVTNLVPSDQVDGAVDAAADKAKEVAPDQADGAIDSAAQAAKDAL
jgi:hypothetical protein